MVVNAITVQQNFQVLQIDEEIPINIIFICVIQVNILKSNEK